MHDLVTDPAEILRANDRGGYTVPTARLYPYQWNWDSAFVAMGWSTFDEPRAWREIEKLLEGQWDDGMVPHIVFHQTSPDYFPGPELWGTGHAPATSGISQPPILATAVRWIHARARDRALADDRAAAFVPRLAASHAWWARARDPEGSGLAAMLHPWESGMDNSPAWDEALARVPRVTKGTYIRRDTGFVDADQRPRQDQYDRFMHLVELYRDSGWRADEMWRRTPFKVADIAINSILHRADTDLLALAQRFGDVGLRATIASRLDARARALDPLWSETLDAYRSRDLIAGRPIDVATNAGFLPLFAGLPDRARAARMVRRIEAWIEQSTYALPTVAPTDPLFDGKRYWRGPVWAIVNWMLIDGLRAYDAARVASRIWVDTATLTETSGFAEYFDPTTGAGLGGRSFSWTAAIALLLRQSLRQ